ncbi:PREDICTED: peptide methionine sulfoxide reductase-like [Nicotiana attenuata]|uniref:peptide-methionine (S)-S-oxide reductase n=1 Tax=Nicotiana attenuata TaxID=49451 RepID=A0A314L0P1_NICAT|nr:PREDICTED: peptide methionine sulfoxide reductase-like [Nicotiana attenuata]OIT35218.1 peptide methionine sulfoxide reductase a4, chloroplastic [Nicotiana attenuata]
MRYFKLLGQSKAQDSDNTLLTANNIPTEFLCHAIFAGDKFHDVEAAYGRVEGVVKTATGYCGGNIRKPSYREVSEGRTGHTEAVKITYDKRVVSYTSLCDFFWEIHDPTNKHFLNFGLSTHLRSAIFCSTEEERKQAQESKIRRQMKLNRRILTKITPFSKEINCEFFLAENQHQKYYLHKYYKLCQSLNLRSTQQFVDSYIACKFNGVLALDVELILDKLPQLSTTCLLPKQCRSTCDEIIQDLKRSLISHTS